MIKKPFSLYTADRNIVNLLWCHAGRSMTGLIGHKAYNALWNLLEDVEPAFLYDGVCDICVNNVNKINEN